MFVNNVVLVNNDKQHQAIHYDRDIYGHVTFLMQQPIKTKLCIHIRFNKHTTIITVNIVVNNVRVSTLVEHTRCTCSAREDRGLIAQI